MTQTARGWDGGREKRYFQQLLCFLLCSGISRQPFVIPLSFFLPCLIYYFSSPQFKISLIVDIALASHKGWPGIESRIRRPGELTRPRQFHNLQYYESYQVFFSVFFAFFPIFSTLNCCNDVNDGKTDWLLRFRCSAARRSVVSEILRDMPPLPAADMPLRWSGGRASLSIVGIWGGGRGDVGVGGGGPPPPDAMMLWKRGFLRTVWVPRHGSLHFNPGPARKDLS